MDFHGLVLSARRILQPTMAGFNSLRRILQPTMAGFNSLRRIPIMALRSSHHASPSPPCPLAAPADADRHQRTGTATSPITQGCPAALLARSVVLGSGHYKFKDPAFHYYYHY